MKYRANPVIVDAFKITRVSTLDSLGMRNVTLDEFNDDIFVATPEMCARMAPSVGDYWVIQSDNHIYLNPREVFERKYAPVTEEAKSG